MAINNLKTGTQACSASVDRRSPKERRRVKRPRLRGDRQAITAKESSEYEKNVFEDIENSDHPKRTKSESNKDAKDSLTSKIKSL